MDKYYSTERLILKVLNKTYAEEVLDYYLRNREFLEEWEALKCDEFYTKEYHEKLLEDELASIEDGKLLKLWIIKKDNESRVIGCISFNNIVKGAFLSCHLGYKLDKDEINKGFITEAVKKGIEIMFDKFNLHRIEANIMPKNKRSQRVVEKLGFYNEGLAKKYLKINGRWEDHIHMVLLNNKL
jgi:[ribosomal protein S5]-alanine N-acetyltransferase